MQSWFLVRVAFAIQNAEVFAAVSGGLPCELGLLE